MKLAIIRAHGTEVPFVRLPELSDDHTGTIPVIAHTIDWINCNAGPVDFARCIYATAPFVQAEDLRRGFDLLQHISADSALSVASYTFPIQRTIRITADQRVELFSPEHFTTRSQNLEEAFHDASPVTLPRHRVQDIDTAEDWEHAEGLFNAMQLQAVRGRR